jgi:hypothetical protein
LAELLVLEIALLQPADLHEGAEQTHLQRTIAVNGNDQALAAILHDEDMMASVNSRQLPPALTARCARVRAPKPALNCDLDHLIRARRFCRSVSGQKPAFDCFVDVGAKFIAY